MLRFARFVIGGGLNTVVGYAVFIALSFVLHYALAFTIAYASGVLLSYWIAAKFVFKTGFAIRSAIRFPFIYIAQYLYGLAALTTLVDIFGLLRPTAMLLVIVTTMPLTFAWARQVMKVDPSDSTSIQSQSCNSGKSMGRVRTPSPLSEDIHGR
jgi:putative flippase GtrA